jgi:hypothetical protein
MKEGKNKGRKQEWASQPSKPNKKNNLGREEIRDCSPLNPCKAPKKIVGDKNLH